MEDPNPTRGLWRFRSLSHLRDGSARLGEGTLRPLHSNQQPSIATGDTAVTRIQRYRQSP
jgi:hypothetical protein